jgi:hypothetical protein
MGELNRGERLQIMLTPEELRTIDIWRFGKRMPSRAAAIREPLKRGLAAEGFGEVQTARNPGTSRLCPTRQPSSSPAPREVTETDPAFARNRQDPHASDIVARCRLGKAPDYIVVNARLLIIGSIGQPPNRAVSRRARNGSRLKRILPDRHAGDDDRPDRGDCRPAKQAAEESPTEGFSVGLMECPSGAISP